MKQSKRIEILGMAGGDGVFKGGRRGSEFNLFWKLSAGNWWGVVGGSGPS
jgi:hypothetical protein